MSVILIIDDDAHIREMLRQTLTGEGYTVFCAGSVPDALLVLADRMPDLILLDLMLPGLSGESLLPRIREIPVIVISAKAEIADKVELLMSGAADYLTKPFAMPELLARIAVQLRKTDGRALRFGNLTLEPDTLTARIDGREIRLTRTECAILKLLMQSPNRPVGKSTILDRISADTPDCTERSLKQHISNIRRKLEAVGGRDYIEAVYGIGFRMKS
ncbi:MAG: response regulator transcription factor [Clostridia bacterium]|nr:response regulator transcription factor [Clostridia bacterium]MBR5365949.1 response regulator transcription factor [Clostridia bacterium]